MTDETLNDLKAAVGAIALLCTLLMLGLKIVGLVNASWALVFAPVLAPLVLWLVCALIWSLIDTGRDI